MMTYTKHMAVTLVPAVDHADGIRFEAGMDIAAFNRNPRKEADR